MHKPFVVASVATWIRAIICARASVAAAFRMVEKYDVFLLDKPLRQRRLCENELVAVIDSGGCGFRFESGLVCMVKGSGK